MFTFLFQQLNICFFSVVTSFLFILHSSTYFSLQHRVALAFTSTVFLAITVASLATKLLLSCLELFFLSVTSISKYPCLNSFLFLSLHVMTYAITMFVQSDPKAIVFFFIKAIDIFANRSHWFSARTLLTGANIIKRRSWLWTGLFSFPLLV